MEKVETTIIGNLIFNEDFSRKVLPFVKKDYFENFHEKVIFEEVSDFIVKYNSMPTKQALVIDIEKRTDLSDDVYKQVCDCLENLQDIPNDKQWLLDTAEKWCRDRAIYLALVQSISIADGNNEEKGRDAIPSILSDALSVSFDNHVGHDYLQDYEERYDFYHQTEEKIPFDLDFFNKITKGGLVNKSLNVALAGTGVGKSLFMCHMDPLLVCYKAKTSCILQWKWQRKRLQNVLMLIF